MGFWEAVKAIEEGKKVRRTYWEKDAYIYIDHDNILRDNYNNPQDLYYIPNDDDDWEIYEEKREVDERFKEFFHYLKDEHGFVNNQYSEFIYDNNQEDYLLKFYMQLLEMEKYYNFD